MRQAVTIRPYLLPVLVVLWGLSVPSGGSAQETPLIHACVDARGSLRIVAPVTACTAKETRLSWPAEPSASPGVTFYQRTANFLVQTDTPASLAVHCDDPADTATGGGYIWEQPGVTLFDSAILASASCRASGACLGPQGQDGWYLVAVHRDAPRRVHTYVICAQP